MFHNCSLTYCSFRTENKHKTHSGPYILHDFKTPLILLSEIQIGLETLRLLTDDLCRLLEQALHASPSELHTAGALGDTAILRGLEGTKHLPLEIWVLLMLLLRTVFKQISCEFNA